jgi:hypothetical protein
MGTKLCRNTSTSTARVGEHFRPLPVSLAKTRNVRKVDRQRGCSIYCDQTNDNSVAQGAGPVRVQLAVYRCSTAGWAEVSRCFTERVLVDCKERL